MVKRGEVPEEGSSAREPSPEQAQRVQQEMQGLVDQALYGVMSEVFQRKPLLKYNPDYVTGHLDKDAVGKAIYSLQEEASKNNWDAKRFKDEFQKKVIYLAESGEAFDETGKKVFTKRNSLESRTRVSGPVDLFKGRKRRAYARSDLEIDEAINREGPAVYELSKIVLSNQRYIQRHPELAQRLLKVSDNLTTNYNAVNIMEAEGILTGRKAREMRAGIYKGMREAEQYAVKHLEEAILGERVAAAVLGVIGLGALAVNFSNFASLGTAAVTGIAGNFAVTSIVGIGLLIASLGLFINSFKR